MRQPEGGEDGREEPTLENMARRATVRSERTNSRRISWVRRLAGGVLHPGRSSAFQRLTKTAASAHTNVAVVTLDWAVFCRPGASQRGQLCGGQREREGGEEAHGGVEEGLAAGDELGEGVERPAAREERRLLLLDLPSTEQPVDGRACSGRGGHGRRGARGGHGRGIVRHRMDDEVREGFWREGLAVSSSRRRSGSEGALRMRSEGFFIFCIVAESFASTCEPIPCL